MAYETGIAAGYRDFYRRMLKFITTNAELVANGDEWEILRGYAGTDVEYLFGTEYESNGVPYWDVSHCMGWDDTYRGVEHGENRKGAWLAAWTQAPCYVGFKSLSGAVQPTYYTMTATKYPVEDHTERYRMPHSWVVEYSDDGTIWNTSNTVSSEAVWGNAEERTYAITEASPHQYWRIRATGNYDGTYVSIGRLRFYNAADAWISRGYTNDLILKAPGFAGTDPVYCGTRMHIDHNNYYNIEVSGQVGYDPDYYWTGQPSITQDIYSPLWEFDMQYWFVCNGHRFIAVFNAGERWHSIHLGKFLPYGSVAQYPYPVLIGASKRNPTAWVDTLQTGHWISTTANSNSAALVYMAQTGWRALWGRGYTTGDVTTGQTNCITPPVGYIKAGDYQMPNGGYVLVPLLVEMDNRAWGHIDGVRWVSGDNQIPGNIIDVDGQEWLVFANNPWIDINDFAALELK